MALRGDGDNEARFAADRSNEAEATVGAAVEAGRSDGGVGELATRVASLEATWQAALRRPGGAAGPHGRTVAEATAAFADELAGLGPAFFAAEKRLTDQVLVSQVALLSLSLSLYLVYVS